MTITQDDITAVLRQVRLPDGSSLVEADRIRALSVTGGKVSFVIEAPDAAAARDWTAVEAEAKARLLALEGVETVSVVTTAHGPAGRAPAGGSTPPDLKIGRHPTPQQGKTKPAGVRNVIAIASGKGGVGKSTVAANLAVALARLGRRVGLLDADIYGPSQPRMMGVNRRPASPDGKTIEPLHAHGVTLMSIGFMIPDGEAVVWRGPMLMGAMQQMLGQVAWGELDVLLIDMPPGTGDVQLTLGQKTELTGALVVSTPQDVALIDARRGISMFQKLNVPVLGLIENMSTYVCPNCGHEAHIFGHGGVAAEAEALGVPLLAQLPLALEARVSGDEGRPVAADDGPLAEPYLQLADRLVKGGLA
ncbi:Mrp/NBP35 family ATP-binding protein [Celeribacter indicus]|uniref:Iron-sulfur cluster carrier protein n=1 Tax=Celeribacter indicus TaxID=1208324 RepID=A0A0B5E6I5_9RHOB|nr:Mrp/NBP35 family ATP-binding protein [Celeribacter indicus]AJE47932.1 septum formation inhibitor-activating ATPase-like protein [Celeribacter indicus]SDW27290.1 ATP-binding protein involved in chromosome partitioning [Celeribacter indicus]